MRRRDCLRLLAAAALTLPPLPVRAQEMAWDLWKRAFLLPDGRVVDAVQGGISHSEGQSYGLLLAVAMNDWQAFVRIRDWTEANLAVRRDPLLAWRWVPGEMSADRDYNNASDGDLFYAWALLRGARRFGTDPARAIELAQALVEICLASDPRGAGRVLLLPGAEGFRSAEGTDVNLSYVMPLALHELAAAADQPRLAACAEDGVRLMWDLAQTGPIPDWIRVTARGWQPSPLERPVGGYDALRIPLWLLWSGRAGHPVVMHLQGSSAPVPAATPDWAEQPGYAAIAALARCSASGTSRVAAYVEGQSYYGATLHLLAHVAARELAQSCDD